MQKATHAFVLAADSEALETQSWLESAVECSYTEKDVAAELFKLYDRTVGALVSMRNNPDQWIIPRVTKRSR